MIEGVVMKFVTFGRIAVAALLIAAPLGVASVAGAADMPVKAPKAAPPPAFDWNGFYIGAYAGAAWMDQANTTDPCFSTLLAACNAAGVGTYNFLPPAAYDMNSSFVGGGTVGYNWQPTPFTLLGLENDIGYIHLKGSILMNPPQVGIDDTVATTKIGDWYDAFTARIGAVDGHAMFYVKGGGVVTKYTTGVVDTNPAGFTINTTTNKTLTGWTAGGGVEYGIDMHWSLKAEYNVLGIARNVTNCGTAFVGGVVPLAPPMCSVTHTPDVQMITVGLNYRFR
jgi:outer membrane immunogenic protein